MREAAVIELSGVVRRYGATSLRFPDWRVVEGSQWLVMGYSGSGKSTLLAIVAGLLEPSEGNVTVDGQRLSELSGAALDRFRGRTIGFVPQQPHLLPTLSVRENLEVAQYLAGLPVTPAELDSVLARLGIAGKAGLRPHQLSRGEAQRAAVGRAVINRPRLLLADEPTANLDDANCRETLDLLMRQAQDSGATLVVATHDGRVKAAFGEHLELGGVV